MRGVYTASIKISALTAAKTLAYITAPAGAAIEIISAYVTNESNETNEQCACTLQRITTLGTPTGTSLTPAKTEAGDQASGATVVGNITANEPTYTSNTDHGHDGFPSIGGWAYTPVWEERMYIAPGASVGLRNLNSLTSTDVDVRITWREIG